MQSKAALRQALAPQRQRGNAAGWQLAREAVGCLRDAIQTADTYGIGRRKCVVRVDITA